MALNFIKLLRKRFRGVFPVTFIIFVLITCLLCFQGIGQYKLGAKVKPSRPFRIIGYLRTADLSSANYPFLKDKLVTQINIAFINPDENGVIKEMPSLGGFVAMAHRNGILVFASIGGGHRHLYFDSLLNQDHRGKICNAYLNFMEKYNLDGLDVDIENEDITADYAPFVGILATKLHKVDKQLSAALSYSTRNKISDQVLRYYDFITLMAYDKTGPWRPNDPGQHAPYEMSVAQLHYWEKDRGVQSDRVVLGVPFYGYGFGKDTAFAMSYSEIVNRYSGADTKNNISLENGTTIFYNGKDLIQQKVELAKREGSGIMIWHLKQDAVGEKSLLRAIHQIL